jgi:hypothetical protein
LPRSRKPVRVFRSDEGSNPSLSAELVRFPATARKRAGFQRAQSAKGGPTRASSGHPDALPAAGLPRWPAEHGSLAWRWTSTWAFPPGDRAQSAQTSARHLARRMSVLGRRVSIPNKARVTEPSTIRSGRGTTSVAGAPSVLRGRGEQELVNSTQRSPLVEYGSAS